MDLPTDPVDAAPSDFGEERLTAVPLQDAEAEIKANSKSGAGMDSQSDDFPMTHTSLSEVFVGASRVLIAKIKMAFNLPDPWAEQAGSIHREVQGHSFTFTRRSLHGHWVWTMNRDEIEQIGRVVGVHIRQPLSAVGNDEIPITGIGLRRLYRRCSDSALAEIYRKLSLPDLNSSETRAVRVIKDESIELFKRTLRGGHVAWVIKAAQLDTFARNLALTPRSSLQTPSKDELSVTTTDAPKYTQRDPSKFVAKFLEVFSLPRPDTESATEVTRDVGNNCVTFRLRIQHGVPRWTFEKSQLDLILKCLGARPRPQLPPKGPTDVAVSQKGLRGSFAAAIDISKFKEFLTLPDPETATENTLIRTLENMTVTFERKLNAGGHIVWVFPEKDIPVVGRAIGLNPRISLVAINQDEISMGTWSITEHYTGEPTRVLAKIKKVLKFPDPKSYSENEFSCETSEGPIVLKKRLNAPYIVWAVASRDVERLGRAVGLQLAEQIEELSTTEIAVSGNALAKYLIGVPLVLARSLKNVFELPDPRVKVEDEIVRSCGEREVKFYRRASSNNRVWAFKKEDLDVVVEAIKGARRVERQTVQPGEIALTNQGLVDLFIGDVQSIEQRITDVFKLPDPLTVGNEGITRTVGGERVTFFVRENSGNRNYFIHQNDLPAFTSAVALRRRDQLSDTQTGETPLSENGLKNAGLAIGMRSFQKLRAEIGLPDAETYPEDSLHLVVDGRSVDLVKRRHGAHRVFALSPQALHNLQLGLSFRLAPPPPQLSPDEISVDSTLTRHLVGEAISLLRAAQAKFKLPDAQVSKESQLTWAGDGEVVTFELRSRGLKPKPIWSFPSHQLSQVAKILETRARHEVSALEPGEFPLTTTALCKRFVGTSSTITAKLQENLALPPAGETHEKEVSRLCCDETVVFRRRQILPNEVWVVDESQVSKFAKHVGLVERNFTQQTSDADFLREQLDSDEARGIELIAAELGEAARAEYLCAKFQDRFQYSRPTIENLRSWLGPVEVSGLFAPEQAPIGLFTITELSDLRAAFFNRMRDQYQQYYRQGFEVVTAKLELAKARAKFPEQAAFVQELIDYFTEVETLPSPMRLKETIRGDNEFPGKHQKIAIVEVIHQRSLLLADGMGGGKTGSVIAAFEHLRDHAQASKCLISCPAQVISVWREALSDSAAGYYKPGCAPRVVIIGDRETDWDQAKDAEIVVCSIEMARGSTGGISHESRLQNMGFDFFAVDEAHNVKKPLSSDTERIFRIGQAPSILNGHLVLTTGTPIPNTVRDIAVQIRLLYAEREPISGVDITDISALTHAITTGHPLLVRNLLVRKMLRRPTEDCLPVGCEFHRELVTCELDALERARYDAVLDCPFYEPAEKIGLLRRLCIGSETKYELIRAAIENAMQRPKYQEAAKSPKIVIAETNFARGVTRDELDRRDSEDAEVETFIAGRLARHYGQDVEFLVLDGKNSRYRDRIIAQFKALKGPAILCTLTSVAGEGLDLSCASDGILISPSFTVANEEQFSRRLYRFGQEEDVHLQVLAIEHTIERGINDYAKRKSDIAEDFLNGRPLSADELQLLEGDISTINRGGRMAYEVLGPREKVSWIISRIYGKGKEDIRTFFSLENGRYARDFAAYYPLSEEVSYSGNTARLVAGIISNYRNQDEIKIADIACGCRTLERMFHSNDRIFVASTDINRAMLEMGAKLLGDGDSTYDREVCAMDELPYEDSSMDVAVISLALHYTRHNSRIGEAGMERIRAIFDLKRVLKPDGIGILTFPEAAFAGDEAFQNFSAVFESYFGFKVIAESSGLARSSDQEGTEPFRGWALTLRNHSDENVEAMTPEAWRALAFVRVSNGSSDKKIRPGLASPNEEEFGCYHDRFEIGGNLVVYSPETVTQSKIKEDYLNEKIKYGRLQDRLRALTDQYASIMEIPEAVLLSISLEEVSSATQMERDHYFQVLLERYGGVTRVPVEEVSSRSPVILIRGESRKGPYLCLGRIDGTNNKPCGYGRRYFYAGDI